MKRKQLTLFLDEKESKIIETVRKKYNPRQYELIKSHITLCREDEIEDIRHIKRNLENLDVYKFVLLTNGLIRFSGGKGLLISIIDKEQKFQKLRELVLQNEVSNPREHIAHITIMHPRNSICDDTKFKEIQNFELPKKLGISKISLIEQEIGKEWKTLKAYELKYKNES
ncbi:2'-5' RNA ligase family protein [Ichthyenterobacterium sp. W332]|uniref:2'-5' RNA ligase family protein n=1 Tax=Microcosmobacter mediterraneus TaxID=3075607 RepID=A0ABU2YN07_9FLAO|nr:2'-5' RNA ligase family protein [Ichthyenterobacterium sp. W332]MDT0559552.1 2'-5' RNA ligase family protein [Ichthyenterobacterium sp. W332]